MAEPNPKSVDNLRRGRSNLKRGHPKGVPNPGSMANAEDREQRDLIDREARDDPDAVLEIMFAEAAKFTAGRLRKLNRQKGPIERTEVEMIRETRQLADRTWEIRQAKGATAPAVALVATLDSRLAAVAAVLEGRSRPFESPEAS